MLFRGIFQKVSMNPYLLYHIVKFLPHFMHTFIVPLLNFFPNFNLAELFPYPISREFARIYTPDAMARFEQKPSQSLVEKAEVIASLYVLYGLAF